MGFNPLHFGAVVASRVDEKTLVGALRFNPLHFGAVVASSRRRVAEGPSRLVSIPFISGQWSLHHGGDPRRLRHARRFNPLHFIAGQWSLLIAMPPEGNAKLFQSPSLRGSGRFY